MDVITEKIEKEDFKKMLIITTIIFFFLNLIFLYFVHAADSGILHFENAGDINVVDGVFDFHGCTKWISDYEGIGEGTTVNNLSCHNDYNFQNFIYDTVLTYTPASNPTSSAYKMKTSDVSPIGTMITNSIGALLLIVFLISGYVWISRRVKRSIK